MRENNKKTKNVAVSGNILSEIGHQLQDILAQLDEIHGAEIIAIRVEEALCHLEAVNAINCMRGLDKSNKT